MIWGGGGGKPTIFGNTHMSIYIYACMYKHIYIYKHQTQTKFQPEHVVETVPTTWWELDLEFLGVEL